jgi:hypothetical protein
MRYVVILPMAGIKFNVQGEDVLFAYTGLSMGSSIATTRVMPGKIPL